jgi:hypothetical protein
MVARNTWKGAPWQAGNDNPTAIAYTETDGGLRRRRSCSAALREGPGYDAGQTAGSKPGWLW